MVGIALLGAGIFAREEHLPAVEADPTLTLKAVYSRSQKSAEALAGATRDPSSVTIYYDEPATPGKSLDDLLANKEIEAVVVVLPILTQPDVIARALDAGKHVLSEKPVAKDVATAQKMLAAYTVTAKGNNPKIWAVAENFRFQMSLNYAAAKLKEIGGDVTTFRLQMNSLVQADNKYFNTEWRKVPDYQGGFLLDGGVHFIAALRLLLAAPGADNRIAGVAAFSNLLEERLPPVDTVHAVAVTKSGRSGTIAISFGTEFKSGLEIEIVTTKGAVIWNPRGVKTVTKDPSTGEKVESEDKYPNHDSGVKAEVAQFARSIAEGKVEADAKQSPSEALGDLEVIQALLESGKAGGLLKRIPEDIAVPVSGEGGGDTVYMTGH